MRLSPEQIAEAKSRIDGEPLVLSISGGKDSTATALALIEAGIDFSCIHMDTGWEHKWTNEYVREYLPKVLDREIEILSRPGGGMVELIKKKGMFPSRLRRFCTQELKVFPFLKHFKALIELGADPVSVVGIRAQESRARAKLDEWEYAERLNDILVWRPIIRWSFDGVIKIHQRHNVKPNPLYLKYGAERVGCWPCIFMRKAELAMLSEKSPVRVERIRKLESEVKELAIARLAKRGETFESLNFSAPCFFRARAQEKDKDGNRYWGRHDWPIDRVLAWARGDSPQLELFGPAPGDHGCMRWGMCDVAQEVK